MCHKVCTYEEEREGYVLAKMKIRALSTQFIKIDQIKHASKKSFQERNIIAIHGIRK